MTKNNGARRRPLSPRRDDENFPSPPLSTSPSNSSYMCVSRPTSPFPGFNIPNSAFNPNPTSTGKCSYLKVDLHLGSTTFVAGGDLYGYLEVECYHKSMVRLGEIAVELDGLEELNIRGESFSRSCLSLKHVFQGRNTPPSHAVKGPSENGFRLAKKRKTTFSFVFKLPETLPSSFKFQTASIRYSVTGVVQFLYQDRHDSMFKVKEATVLDNRREPNPTLPNPATAVFVENMETFPSTFGGAGTSIEMRASLPRRRFCIGESMQVDLTVRNNLRRKIQGIKLVLNQKMVVLRGTESQDNRRSRITSSVIKQKIFMEHSFEHGESRTIRLFMDVPNNILTVLNTELVQISCGLDVLLSIGSPLMPTFVSLNSVTGFSGMKSQSLSVELPIEICNSLSLEVPPTANPSFRMLDSELPPPSPYIPARKVQLRNRAGRFDFSKLTLSRSLSPDGTISSRAPGALGRHLPWCEDEEDEEDFIQQVHQRPQSAASMREFEYDSENEEILYSNEHEAPSPVSTKGTPRNLLDLRMTPNSDILNEIAPLIPGLQNIDFNHRAQAGAPQPLFRDRVQFDHTPSPHQRREMSPSPPPHGRSKSPPVMPRPKNYISRYASRSPTPREAPKHPSPPQSDFTNVAHGMSSPIDISDGRGNRHYEEMKALQGTRELDHQFGYFNYSPPAREGRGRSSAPVSPVELQEHGSPQPPPKSPKLTLPAFRKLQMSEIDVLSPILKPVDGGRGNVDHHNEVNCFGSSKGSKSESKREFSPPPNPKSPRLQPTAGHIFDRKREMSPPPNPKSPRLQPTTRHVFERQREISPPPNPKSPRLQPVTFYEQSGSNAGAGVTHFDRVSSIPLPEETRRDQKLQTRQGRGLPTPPTHKECEPRSVPTKDKINSSNSGESSLNETRGVRPVSPKIPVSLSKYLNASAKSVR